MARISYIKLYSYLTETANYERISALRTIFRLRKLPKELLYAVSQIMDGKSPTVSVNEVSYEELVERDGLKPIAAILMLDWLRREPESALSYLSECTLRSPIMPLTDEQHNELDQAIAQLEKDVKGKVEPVNPYDDSSEDINVENAPTIDEGKTSLQEFIEEINQEESLNGEKQAEPIEAQKKVSSKEDTPLEELHPEEPIELDVKQNREND